ncbi:MAG: hypothetical protein NC115_13005 [Bacteroidales bacterium]|nr:hypothetical protein [Bacteroidales bacterium]
MPEGMKYKINLKDKKRLHKKRKRHDEIIKKIKIVIRFVKIGSPGVAVSVLCPYVCVSHHFLFRCFRKSPYDKITKRCSNGIGTM